MDIQPVWWGGSMIDLPIDIVLSWDRDDPTFYITQAQVYDEGSKIMYIDGLDAKWINRCDPPEHMSTYNYESENHKDTVSLPTVLVRRN